MTSSGPINEMIVCSARVPTDTDTLSVTATSSTALPSTLSLEATADARVAFVMSQFNRTLSELAKLS